MRTTSRWSYLPVSTFAALVGLMAAGCSNDTPTSAVQLTPMAFREAPRAAAIAKTASHITLWSTPSIPVWKAQHPGGSQAGDAIIESPFDLTYVGGPVITGATEWAIYTNCAAGPAACWGTGNLTPATVLRDLNRADILTVDGQYVGEDPRGHFRVRELSTDFTFSGAPTAGAPGGTASQDDIFNIVASAVIATGASGYGNEFHVFLPQGTDMCRVANFCYAPDQPIFQFCAFHGSVDFEFSPTDIRHVIYSVEPYQGTQSCLFPTQRRVIDGTASTLSHEFQESITDPDGDAWFNQQFLEEIGDLCFAFRFDQRVGEHVYAIQTEYSNAQHACATETPLHD